MLDVGTHPKPVENCRASSARSIASSPRTGARSSDHGTPAAWRWASATRSGRRTAASPPASGTVARWAIRRALAASASRTSPPQIVPSGPYPVPSKAKPSTRAEGGSPRSAITAATCAWWCCTATTRSGYRVRAQRAARDPGCPSTATTSGSMRRSDSARSIEVSNRSRASAESRSPMWGLSHTSAPEERQTVFLSSPPTASTALFETALFDTALFETALSSRTGAHPRARRSHSGAPFTTRTTESSQGAWIGRSCVSTASHSGRSASRWSSQ